MSDPDDPGAADDPGTDPDEPATQPDDPAPDGGDASPDGGRDPDPDGGGNPDPKDGEDAGPDGGGDPDPGEGGAQGPDAAAPVPEGWRRRLYRLATTSPLERLLISVAALVLSILVGAVLVLAAGWLADCGEAALVVFEVGFCYDPVQVYTRLFLGAFGDPLSGGWTPLNFATGLTFKETTLLVFTGLSVVVAFRAGLFNIGTQGQLVFGGLASAVVVLYLAPYAPSGLAGSFVLVPAAVLTGAVVGGIYGAIPGALKAYADANEVITTIMLNFIALKVAFVLTAEVFKDPNSQAVQTRPIPQNAQLSAVVFPDGGDFSLVALALAVALVFGVFYLLWNTSFGFDLRTGGIQPEAATYGGVEARRMMVAAMTLSGALGGVGGTVWVLMVNGRFVTDVPALGFDGITVSILAGNHPLGAALAALLFGVLKSGSIQVEFATGVPRQLVGVLRGLVILFVAMPEFFRMIGRRTVVPDRERRAAAADGGRPVDRAGSGEGADGPAGGTDRSGDGAADDAAGDPGGDRDE